MGLLEVVFVLLLALKLLGFISVSWWVVFLPVYPALFIWLLVAILNILYIALGAIKK